MSKKIQGPVDEKQLWHGTSKESSEAICRQNFDFRISGSNVGTLYGQGSYFANNASYSDKYSRPESNIRRMFLVRVLVGSFVKGKPEYKRPPPKDPNEPLGDLHDACVDNELNPSIYVVFDKSQAYPEYLIEYKRSSDPNSPARLPASVPKASTVRTSTSGYSKSQAKASAAVGPSMSSVNTSYMSKTYSDPLAASSGSRYSASSSPSSSSLSSMSSDYTSNTTRATQPAQGLGATGVARTSASNTSARASGSNGSYSPYTSQTSRSSNTTRITQQADQGFDALAAARASVNPSYNSASASWSSDRYSGSTSRSSDPQGASSQTSASSYDPFGSPTQAPPHSSSSRPTPAYTSSASMSNLSSNTSGFGMGRATPSAPNLSDINDDHFSSTYSHVPPPGSTRYSPGSRTAETSRPSSSSSNESDNKKSCCIQ